MESKELQKTIRQLEGQIEICDNIIESTTDETLIEDTRMEKDRLKSELRFVLETFVRNE
jgi:hypothetical protein